MLLRTRFQISRCAGIAAAVLLAIAAQLAAEPPGAPCEPSAQASPSIPVDSWIYPAMVRLTALGYANGVYLGMRPWTRSSLRHVLSDTGARIEDAENYREPTTDEAWKIYRALDHELGVDSGDLCPAARASLRIESATTVTRDLGGQPLHDSFHLGSTVVNDYGRPFENGVSSYSGLSGYAAVGRFLVYARGEFDSAPSAAGYTPSFAATLSSIDEVPFLDPLTGLATRQATIPMGLIAAAAQGRLIEAYASATVRGHAFSLGKQDQWLGPGEGGAMAYSNNAENIWGFEINRVEPLHIPALSRVTGPFRYELLVGALKGHTDPKNPWVHVEKVSFKPTRDLEFGFERTVIWGGQGHEPVTMHSFLRSFFSFDAVSPAVKYSSRDPGARFGAFDFTYRLPFPPNWLVLYADMEAHDTVSPLFKPLHGAFRPGLYLSHFPRLPKLDLRVEGIDTDSSHPSSIGGRYQYWETIQKQGYTNQGELFGDWVGREDKGGQAWTTYHLSGNEWLQLSVRHQKAARDFIPGGTTLNEIGFQAVKRIGKDFEIDGRFAFERWKAPIDLPGAHTATATTVRLTWYPGRKVSF